MRLTDKSKNQDIESHPQLPSGEWEGFYCYNFSPHQHKMAIHLQFSNSIISGAGVDDVAPFSWDGQYDLEDMKLEMIKSYLSHRVIYNGHVDENGIWGTWKLSFATGGFHIWPH